MADCGPTLSTPQDDAHKPTAPHAAVNDVELSLKLDQLLEDYLNLFDQYSKLQEAISEQFAEGFFTLARAQRISGLGAGRRYGQDGFDQRMQAIKRVKLGRMSVTNSSGHCLSDAKSSTVKFECYDYTCQNLSKSGVTDKPTSPRSPPEMPEIKDKAVESSTGNLEAPETHKKPEPGYRNPATWYGLLIPPLLRQTQAHFTKITAEHIPSLLTVRASMEALEQDISSLRAEMNTR